MCPRIYPCVPSHMYYYSQDNDKWGLKQEEEGKLPSKLQRKVKKSLRRRNFSSYNCSSVYLTKMQMEE